MSTKKYIETPNLPDKPVKSVLVDYRISNEARVKLEKQGIKVLFSAAHKTLYEAVSAHPDMQIHHIGNNIFVCEPALLDYYNKILPDAVLIPGITEIFERYPYDIAYNAARVGKHLFHKLKYTDTSIRECYSLREINYININQGYSKCSICVIDYNAIITSDLKIAKIAEKNEIDALYFNSAEIKLNGVSNGFIGGVCGKISNNTLAVNGNIERLSNSNQIIDFCNKYKVNILNLNNEIPYDIGSIIPLYY